MGGKSGGARMTCRQQDVTVGFNRKSIAIRTPSGILVALLAGRPEGQTWDKFMGGLDAEMTESAGQMTFPGDPAERRRGPYRSVNTGISYGGGSKVRGSVLRMKEKDFLTCEDARGAQDWGKGKQ